MREAERADAFEERFREELQTRGLDGEWHIADHTDAAGLIKLAEAADLALLGQYPGDDSDGVTWLRPDHVVTAVGRPVLRRPLCRHLRVGRQPGARRLGRNARGNRALHDALPLIHRAEAVTVLYVGTHDSDLDLERPRLERVIRHLQR